MAVLRSARVLAHAKMNLGLRILYRRPDRFHEIRTIFQTISLADRLTVRYTAAARTSIETVDALAIADNLIEKAARLCLAEMELHARIEFELKKEIPMGAGLGGGSSDAAAVLLTLPVLAGRTIPMERLRALAESLGSDVPFFLMGGTAVGLGKGEELYPLPELPGRAAIVVAPGIHVSTPEAYRALSEVLVPFEAKIEDFQLSAIDPLGRDLHNDFESVVFAMHPALGAWKARLVEHGASPALMSGSGSSLFGIFESPRQVRRVVQSLSEENVYPVTLLNRARYRAGWLRRLKPHLSTDHLTTTLWPPRSRYAQ